MKSQTKIIIAALVAAVVAFSAVGATYAWFSDDEKTDVSVSTGTVDVSYEASDLKMYSYDKNSSATDKMEEVSGTFACGGTATLGFSDTAVTIDMKNAAPGDRITFTLTAYNESSLNIIYRTLMGVSGETGDLKIQTKAASASDYTDATSKASDWSDVILGVNEKKQLGEAMDVFIEIPIESVNAVSCDIVFTLEAVQSNADPYIYISSVDQLYAFANDVNIAGNNYKDKTVLLCADLDLGGAEWTPLIGVADSKYASWGGYTSFFGIFDGQGHTISNFAITADDDAGFFGILSGTVKNLNIDKETIVTDYHAGGIAARAYYADIIGCSVSNSNILSTPAFRTALGTYDDGNNVGGIVGNATSANVTSCTVKSTTIAAYRSFGGIAGVSTGTISGCTVSTDVVLQQNMEHDYKNYGTSTPDNVWGTIASKRNAWTDGGNNSTDVLTMTKINMTRTISTADELYAFAEEVNSGCTFVGKTVTLANDIDLGGAEWTPISGDTDHIIANSGTVYSGFLGTFDGQEKTVSNFKVTEVANCAGFFGQLLNATVKELTIDNATIASNHYSGGIAGHSVKSTITNCKVTNSNISATVEEISEGSWDNGDKVGGIVGFATGTIQNCTVSKTTIIAYRDMGGIAGAGGQSTPAGTSMLTITGCSVSDVTICQNLAHDEKNINSEGKTLDGTGYYTWDSICSERTPWTNDDGSSVYTHSATGVTYSQI